MPIVLSEPLRLDDRTIAVAEVATMIEDAMTGDEPVSPVSIADDIVDYLWPRSGASLSAMRGWLDRFRAEHPGALPKPRIRVRAATQHVA